MTWNAAEVKSARRKYLPDGIEWLIVAEAPPDAIDRFFYFEHVKKHDELFLETMKVLYPEAPRAPAIRSEKATWLRRFQAEGFYLIDACDKPIVNKGTKRPQIRDALPSLLGQLAQLTAERRLLDNTKIVLVSVTVFDEICGPLRDAGYNVVNDGPIEFPGNNHQPDYREQLAQLLMAHGRETREPEENRRSTRAPKGVRPDLGETVRQGASARPLQELETILSDGPAADLFRAEEALQIHAVIGERAAEVNASTFKPALVTYQGYAIEQFTLAVARLLEKPNARFQLRSLPAAITFVLEHAAELPIGQRLHVEQGLRRLGAWRSEWAAIDDVSLSRAAMPALLDLLPTPESSGAYRALKALRDKRLAHPENIDATLLPKTTWGEAEALLEPVRQIVGVLGAFVNTCYVDDRGDYILSSDAQRSSIATGRFLDELGIAKPKA